MLENLILSIGSPDFGAALFDVFCREMSVRQVVLNRFEPDRPIEALVAQDNRTDGCVHTLVKDYIRHFHRHDPFWPMFAPSERREVEMRAIAVKEIAESEYAQRLFVGPGIAGKLSIIVRQPRQAICLTLYRDRRNGFFCGDEVARIDAMKPVLAAALERHLALVSRPPAPDVAGLTALLEMPNGGKTLSQREAAVCARVLLGFSNEAVALDLGLSFHSVSTYRRRAYAKLGITSQNELFALILRRNRDI
ncbi:helix-turn-helix transcriptional regulator [Enterovirga aerilata]|uniref:Helix-turn-helix transcriptional regulator n=1 Tax=Enterovirga aerilata TaxID=2730920 RepID=A0A849HZ46_9HYPH|nr:helix-turn-helix transcriptional regulator [Enterovirga sp. DB1703]NNM72816.1 helix-turn-helix transcriptional regulator [Enterovirga sp. DB1703]